jgi:hypothetical protein
MGYGFGVVAWLLSLNIGFAVEDFTDGLEMCEGALVASREMSRDQ